METQYPGSVEGPREPTGVICLGCYSLICEHVAKPRGNPPQLAASLVRILRELKDGPSNKEIGARLGLSPATVKIYVSHILKTLKLDNRVQLALWARDHERLLEIG